jgi:hypothetical protein
MKLLLSAQKTHPYFYKSKSRDGLYILQNRRLNSIMRGTELNGKIVAECDYEVEEIDTMALSEHVYDDYYNDNIDRISKESCLTCEQMCEYLGTTWDSKGYAIHIKNLHMFDTSKELNEVYKIENIGGMLLTKSLEKAPHNMMRASVNRWDYSTYNPDDINVLLPRSPEELCRILNEEQTIIIVKNVLKEMIGE